MIKYIYLLAVVLSNTLSFSQNNQETKKIYILDSIGRRPIDDVDVIIYKKELRDYKISRKEGLIIRKEQIDSVEFSHVSYNKKVLTILRDTILLNRKVFQINPVEINGEISKHITAPFFVRNLIDFTINFLPQEKVAMFIPFDEKNANKKIKFLKYQVADVYGVKNLKYLPFKAGLFSVDTMSMMPSVRIYESDIVKKLDNKKWVSVEVLDYDLVVPKEGIFIIFEILETACYPQEYIDSKVGMIPAVPSLKASLYDLRSKSKSYKKYLFHEKESDWIFLECHFKMDIEYEK